MKNPTIGFVGLGRMGGQMSKRLIDAGSSLSVFDMSAEAIAPVVAAGAAVSASPEAVGNEADIVFVSLPTPDIVEKLFLMAWARALAQKSLLISQPVDPAWPDVFQKASCPATLHGSMRRSQAALPEPKRDPGRHGVRTPPSI